jgi:hypothetical protein
MVVRSPRFYFLAVLQTLQRMDLKSFCIRPCIYYNPNLIFLPSIDSLDSATRILIRSRASLSRLLATGRERVEFEASHRERQVLSEYGGPVEQEPETMNNNHILLASLLL